MSYADHAERLARFWHRGQMRKDGKTPYITHPEAVARMVDGDFGKAVAWMHDILEDTECPASEIMQFPEEISDAVFALTNHGIFPYYDYIDNVARRPLARIVKIADIRHNLSCDPSPKAIRKYHRALIVLGCNP